jgi:transcriptional regulator with XRE-family HTH domain
MEASAAPRFCMQCGTKLASDNKDAACRPCQRADREAEANPPQVPLEFWDNDQLRDALVRERHIGHAVRSYMKHPFHGHRGISQEAAAKWLNISQTQLSRIERGRPLCDLDRLIQWAKRLRIPAGLLWFSLPNEGEDQDVNRRSFLLAGGTATASAGLPAATIVHDPGNSSPSLLNGEACAQWLAWELWNRGVAALNAEEIPPNVRESLAALPPAGTLVLRDAHDDYSFAHPSLVDFFVAQRIFGDLSQGNSRLLTTAQTSHDTDQIIRRFVQHDDACVPILSQWMSGGSTPVLRVNSAGILAKLGQPEMADQVIAALRRDADTRHLYLTAVASRVLSLPWEQAGALAYRNAGLTAQVAMSPDQAAEYAVQLSHEVRNSQDSAARWCSVVLLSRITQPVPALVTRALQETLRGEECRENLRAIAGALSNADPLQM